ncbi:MAG: hypothetical protein WAN34_05985 [Acidimicrobiia bacterium]
MSNDSLLDELVPPLSDVRRWKLLAGVLIVAALLPVGAVSGLVRPNVETVGGGGEWDQQTGIGSMFILLINRGIVAVNVTSADSEWTTLNLDAPVRIAPHTQTQVRVTYTMTCEETVPYESIIGADPAAQTTLHVQGPGPFAVDYGVDRVVEGLLPTSGMCDN